MFGYILPNLESLEDAERQRYRCVYCGVCRSIKNRYGQLPRLSVSYDLTFFALMLGSLYEPKETTGAKRCPMHPAQPQAYAQSVYTDYAADLSIMLAYHKLLDDWNDDRQLKSRMAATALLPAYRRAKRRHPDICADIEEAMVDIRRIEQHAQCAFEAGLESDMLEAGRTHQIPDASSDACIDAASITPDAPANRFGIMLGHLFAYKDDFWATDLRLFGARLGKFVYVMDAAMDLEEDLQTGSYNPFRYIDHDAQVLRDNLEYLAASMTDIFERLPLERDIHLMRSVLYAGVWQRFEAKENKTHHG